MNGGPETKTAWERIEAAELARLFLVLRKLGYAVFGPSVENDAVVCKELGGVSDLPQGMTDDKEAGRYRLHQREDGAFFGYTVGPQTLKRLLFPPKERLYTLSRKGKSLSVEPEPLPTKKIAYVGAKACEVAALGVQDQVFLGRTHPDVSYRARRENLLVLGTDCTQAGKTCFCASMGAGPSVSTGADLVLTEVVSDDEHYFLLRTLTAQGQQVSRELMKRKATQEETETARGLVEQAKATMGRKLDTAGLKEGLSGAVEHPHFEDIASRCLACANCTMVCPTCFCNATEDVSDLAATCTERFRTWDSCFHEDFSYLHGWSIRKSTASRYRQWLAHKLSTWVDQFGRFGCVGCGLCITFCPVGIDLTTEVKALLPSNGDQ